MSKVCLSALQSTLRKQNEDRGWGKFETIFSSAKHCFDSQRATDSTWGSLGTNLNLLWVLLVTFCWLYLVVHILHQAHHIHCP